MQSVTFEQVAKIHETLLYHSEHMDSPVLIEKIESAHDGLVYVRQGPFRFVVDCAGTVTLVES